MLLEQALTRERALLSRLSEFLAVTAAAVLLGAVLGEETAELALLAGMLGLAALIIRHPQVPRVLRFLKAGSDLFQSPVEALASALSRRSDGEEEEIPGSFDRGVGRLVRWLFAGVVLLWMPLALLFLLDGYARNLRAALTWNRAPAVILKTGMDATGRDEFCPVIGYRYEVGGRSYQSKRYAFLDLDNRLRGDEARALIARHRTGERVTIAYDPANPASAVLRVPSARPPWGALIFAVYCLIIVVRFLLRQELEPRLTSWFASRNARPAGPEVVRRAGARWPGGGPPPGPGTRS